MHSPSPLVLMILDGWGYNDKTSHNAIYSANTPQWDEWWETRPHMLLQASGPAVGLPEGQMGNSEVGHMHIGAGRAIPQDFTRINDMIKNGGFDNNETFNQTIDQLKTTGKSLHLAGLLSPGGVHSHEDHLFAFIALCAKKNFHSLCLHLFLDGRDTPPQSAKESLHRLNDALTDYPVGKICSISGRYYAMDRDKRWERIEPVYKLLTQGLSDQHFITATEALDAYYGQGIYDEFIPATRIGSAQPMTDGDAFFFFNFRADRARQLTQALIDPNFSGFKSEKRPKLSAFISMTQYAKTLATQAAFPPIDLNNSLGEVISAQGMKQLRIAETEKYAHVTFFFNGGTEAAFPGEDRILIESPKIATYDLQPEMSAPALTEALIDAINSKHYDLIVCNYANADMVGHSGNFDATVKAIECLDDCMHQIWQALETQQGQLLITADHGNAEKMYNEATDQAHTAHTCDPVPLIYVGRPQWHFSASSGRLTDIAPTLLTLMGLTPPKEMTGEILMDDQHA